jgi:hypothetical protein
LIYLIDKYDLFNEFQINLLDEVESKINSIAPSICEYYFENIILYSQIQTYLNKNYIERSYDFGVFRLHIDYETNIYIEKDDLFFNDDLFEHSTLW